MSGTSQACGPVGSSAPAAGPESSSSAAASAHADPACPMRLKSAKADRQLFRAIKVHRHVMAFEHAVGTQDQRIIKIDLGNGRQPFKPDHGGARFFAGQGRRYQTSLPCNGVGFSGSNRPAWSALLLWCRERGHECGRWRGAGFSGCHRCRVPSPAGSSRFERANIGIEIGDHRPLAPSDGAGGRLLDCRLSFRENRHHFSLTNSIRSLTKAPPSACPTRR